MTNLRLEKRGSGWQYSFEGNKINGKRKRITKGGFKTKAEATAAGTKLMSEYLEDGRTFVPSRISFNDYLDFWMEQYCLLNLKKESYKNYSKRIRIHIKPLLGQYALSALTPAVLQNFINVKAQAGYSRNTLTVLKGILSGSLSYAVKLDYLRHNPMYNVRLPSPRSERIRSRTAPHQYLTPHDISIIFGYFTPGTSVYLPLVLGYRCGLRLGEAFGLTWDNIDFKKKTLRVDKQVQWNQETQCWYISTPKYDSYRTIELDDFTLQTLAKALAQQQRDEAYYGEEYIRNYLDGNLQINTTSGQPIKFVNIRANGAYIQPRVMQHASQMLHYKLGLPNFTFHSLRHTHATMLAENNAPPKYVQERLGHKNIQVTLQVYQHLTKKISQTGTEILEKMFDAG